MENEQKEMWERLTAVEQSTKSAHHRIDTLDKLTESVHIIATETKAMREDVNDITERVDEIEKKPNKRYETVITAVTVSYTHLDVYKRQLQMVDYENTKNSIV